MRKKGLSSAPSEAQKNTESTQQEEKQAPVSQPVTKEQKELKKYKRSLISSSL
jgi:hypothetical protein